MIARERIYLWIIFAPILCFALLGALLAWVLSRVEMPPPDTSGGVAAVHTFLRGMATGDARVAAQPCVQNRRTEVPALLAGRPEIWGSSWRVPSPRLDDSLGWIVDMDISGRDSRIRHLRFVLFTTEGAWWVSEVRIPGERHSLLPWSDPQSLPLSPEVELRAEPVVRRGPDGLRLVLNFRVRDRESTETSAGRSALLHVTLSARRIDERDIFTAGSPQPVGLAVEHRWRDFDAEIPVPERPSGTVYRLVIRVADLTGGNWAETRSTITMP
ncbi:MAG: hypothetical protein HYY18_07725 [Planctomycetes bacterium]|nr:hypothetical protein [Planctomycetota bacterium]